MSNLLESTSKNQIHIDEFVDSLGVLSQSRKRKYRVTLGKISRELGEFTIVDQKKLKEYIIEKNESSLSDHTKRDYRLILKKFFGWLVDREFVSWIRVGNVKGKVGPEDILTADELERVRYQCKLIRDRAIVETLYETAFRPHEFLSLKKNNIKFDNSTTSVYLENGKTGSRRVLVINAGPLLANWIENHPLKDRDAPLWVDMSRNTQDKPLKWAGFNRLIKRLVKNAGVQKSISPYLFRHTRLTELANTLTEAQLCEFAGWTLGSKMSAMYVHLSGRNVDDAILKAHGLQKQETAQIGKTPMKCPRCDNMSEASASTCRNCGLALTLEAARDKVEELDDMKEVIDSQGQLLGKQETIINLLEKRVKQVEVYYDHYNPPKRKGKGVSLTKS